MKKILISAMTVLLLLSAGCEKQPGPDVKPPDETKQAQNVTTPDKKVDTKNDDTAKVEASSKDNKVKSMQITVYYPDQAGMSLIPVKREIKVTEESQKYLAAVNCLLDQPKEEDLTKIFPKGAKIKSITLDKDTAVVDLDSGITKNFVGGSTGEEFLINSVVDTLTEFSEVKQVLFLIDGREVETLAGHMDLSEPIKR